MGDTTKTRQQLIDEIAVLRRRIERLEKSELQRNKAEDALRESEEQFRTLFEQASDGIFVADAQGHYIGAPQPVDILESLLTTDPSHVRLTA